MSYREWSETEDRIILANLKLNYREICDLLNALPEAKDHHRSPNALSNRMSRLAKNMGQPLPAKRDVRAGTDSQETWAQRVAAMDDKFQAAMTAVGYRRTQGKEKIDG